MTVIRNISSSDSPDGSELIGTYRAGAPRLRHRNGRLQGITAKKKLNHSQNFPQVAPPRRRPLHDHDRSAYTEYLSALLMPERFSNIFALPPFKFPLVCLILISFSADQFQANVP